jgi:UDP-N-acetylglucosamine 4,6-dehydratase
VRGQTVLITGGTGTFGSAFVRHALAMNAARVIAVARNSEARYRLQQAYRDPRLTVWPCRVDVKADVEAVFALAGHIDLVVHAAAEKHVTTGEMFAGYTRDVNVGGAYHLIDVVNRDRSTRLIALSTDKACEPCNFYGETKAEAERLFIAAGHTVVRYGNVVGSSGSVMPLFIRQRAAGRITITDRRMTRFFMPIADDSPWRVQQMPSGHAVMSAVGLVQFAIEHSHGGEIFIPTIPSGTIQNLAEQIGPECVIDETGIRPGEKLHEKLVADDEVSRTYRLIDDVFVVEPAPVFYMTPVEPTFRYTSDVDAQPLQIVETHSREELACSGSQL